VIKKYKDVDIEAVA